MKEFVTQKYEVGVGKKPPKEYLDALASGFYEAYRMPVKGGAEIVLAKLGLFVLEGGNSKKTALLLDKLPPDEMILKSVPVQEVKAVFKGEPPFDALYGIADGRKFLVPVVSGPKPKRKS